VVRSKAAAKKTGGIDVGLGSWFLGLERLVVVADLILKVSL